MEQIKLTNAGESLTFTCIEAKVLSVGKWPEAEFTGNDGGKTFTLRMPAASAEKQLGRIALTYQQCAGKILTVSRAANSTDASKPYWNIAVNGTATPSKIASTAMGMPFDQPAPPNFQHVEGLREAFKPAVDANNAEMIYASITSFVLKDIVPMYTRAGIPLDMVAIAAIVNTNFIQASKH